MNRIVVGLAILIVFVALGCGVSEQEYRSVVAELERTRAELSDATNLLQDTSGKLASNQVSLDETLLKLSDMEIQIVSLKGSLDDTTEEKDAALSEMALELEDALAELDVATGDMEFFQAEMVKVVADLSAKSSEAERLESENSLLEEDLASRNAAVDELEIQVANLSSNLADQGQEFAQASDELKGLKDEVSDLEADIASLSKEVEDNSASSIQADIQALKAERDQWIIKVDQLGSLVEPLLSDRSIDLQASGIFCTGSMLPTLHCGDIVFLQTDLVYRDIEVGDIIAFRRRNCFGDESGSETRILHRVVDIDAGWFITKGDNNYFEDSCRLPLLNIEGEVITWVEDLYPEDYIETANFEAEKSNLNGCGSFRTTGLAG